QLNNLSPNQLVLRGELLQLGEWFCEQLERKTRDLVFQFVKNDLKIYFRTKKDDAGVLGAAFLAIDHVFASQELFEQNCPVLA
ncbi:MAG: ROK family protein, partial [Victivallales bacterium]|nr:ROK family protein [Victivallales bacterium]